MDSRAAFSARTTATRIHSQRRCGRSSSPSSLRERFRSSPETWSLTSVYVPRDKENNLAAYMAVNSDATTDDYGKI